MNPRDIQISLIEPFVNLPYRGHESAWQRFLHEDLKLSISYLRGVQKAVNDGKWRAKQEPLRWLQKVGQTNALGLLGIRQEREDRQKVHVGRAVSPEQKRALTREESLQFDRPARILKVYVGNIADLKLPADMGDGLSEENGRRCRPDPEQSADAAIHDEVIDYFNFRDEQQAGIDYGDINIARRLPKKYRLPVSEDDEPRRVNWSAVFRDAGFDPSKLKVQEELAFLRARLTGLSRDVILALERNPDQLRKRQAAAKRLQRHWPDIVRVVRGESKVPPGPTESTQQTPRAPHEILRALAKKKRSLSSASESAAMRFDGSGLKVI